jgi:hypothetical protein
VSILNAKDLASRYKQAYETQVDKETRENRKLITELGGEEPYNILKTYAGAGLDPEEVKIRTRLDKKYDRPARTVTRGGLKLKDMTGEESLEERQEISDFLKEYGASGRIGKGLVAAEIFAGAPSLIKGAPRLYRGFKEKVAPFLVPGVAIPGTVGTLSQSEAEAAPTAFLTLANQSPEIQKLYNNIISGKIKAPRQFVGFQPGSQIFDVGFENMNNKGAVIAALNKFNEFNKKKKGLLSEPEIMDKINKKYPGLLDGILTGSARGLQPTQMSNIVEKELYTILKPKQITLPAVTKGLPQDKPLYVFKDIKAADLKKLNEVYETWLDGRYMKNNVATRIADVTNNQTFRNRIKAGKPFDSGNLIPSLDELKQFTGKTDLTDGEASRLMMRIIDKLNGEKVILPTNYVGRDPFSSLPTGAKGEKLADTFKKELDRLSNESSLSSYYSTLERAIYINQADETLKRPFGSRQSILNRIDTTENDVHEFASLRTAGKSNLNSYSNFVMKLDPTTNKVIGTQQGQLGRLAKEFRNGDISFKEFKNLHNQRIDNYGNEELIAKVISPSEVKKYYGAANLIRFKKDYGMNLLKEAKEAGFGYAIPKNKDGGFTVLEELLRVQKAEGGRVGFVTGGLSESIKEVQEEIKRSTEPLRETIEDISKPYAIKAKELLDDTAEVLNKTNKPQSLELLKTVTNW